MSPWIPLRTPPSQSMPILITILQHKISRRFCFRPSPLLIDVRRIRSSVVTIGVNSPQILLCFPSNDAGVPCPTTREGVRTGPQSMVEPLHGPQNVRSCKSLNSVASFLESDAHRERCKVFSVDQCADRCLGTMTLKYQPCSLLFNSVMPHVRHGDYSGCL